MGFDLGSSNSKGKKQRVKPSMNVTPLVDVVLVLLIIFMVITPLLSKQMYLHVPLKDDPSKPVPPPSDGPPPVVLTVKTDGTLELNRSAVAQADLSDKLRRVFAARLDHVLFFDAQDDVPYGRAMEVLDLARGGGAVTIAVVTEKVVR